MKKTYAQVIKQIETLKQEADKLRRRKSTVSFRAFAKPSSITA